MLDGCTIYKLLLVLTQRDVLYKKHVCYVASILLSVEDIATYFLRRLYILTDSHFTPYYTHARARTPTHCLY